MYLENVVIDAVDPQRLGRFWQAALGTEQLTDEPDVFETRLSVEGGPELDLCFQRVADPTPDPTLIPPRLHLDLKGGVRQTEEVELLLELGARHLDIGQRDVPWVVLADPEDNPFCVLEEREGYAGSGPVACLPQHAADPDRDAEFWAWLTGWDEVDGYAPRSLRHPSMRGPLLEMVPEQTPKGSVKNRLHIDVRLEAGDDADQVAAQIAERGGTEVHHPEWGDLPWRVYLDPSGNEFCVLPARATIRRRTQVERTPGHRTGHSRGTGVARSAC